MLEIPAAKDTDAEDVVWGLQTAETLWKRGERIDALVWLRRAAQAAGDANDDDRALELARHAAELTEWMANADDGLTTTQAIGEVIEEASIEVEEAPPPASVHSAVTTAPPAATAAPPPFRAAPEPKLPLPAFPPPVAPAIVGVGEDDGRPSATSVLPAEKVHAGMFDPWADQASQLAPNPPPPPPSRRDVPEPEEEVVTSVRPNALARPASEVPVVSVPAAPPSPVPPPPKPSRPNVASKPPAAPKPPPLPPRARPPLPKPSAPAVPAAPAAAAPVEPPRAAPPVDAPVVVAQPVAPSPPRRATTEPEDETSADVAVPEVAAYVPPPEELLSSAPPALDRSPSVDEPELGTSAPSEAQDEARDESLATDGASGQRKLDLDDVEAFADLPDDARTAFATAAELHSLAEGEEIGTFALAYIVSGAFDVAATVVDAPAVRLSEGAVLRARGTTDENVPIRLICAKESGVLATWSDASVEEAFRTIPWVEDDLRSAADRVQTLVGITIGPLGERLDVSIREEIVGRLTMRPLIPGEVVVNEGEPVPGLLLVGIGELELIKGDQVVGQVSSGDFLFATEVLGAGSAPATARAGKGGALVMFGDRRIAQELLVTCPPLLEVFAGM